VFAIAILPDGLKLYNSLLHPKYRTEDAVILKLQHLYISAVVTTS
jgi:hypothetical protein